MDEVYGRIRKGKQITLVEDNIRKLSSSHHGVWPTNTFQCAIRFYLSLGYFKGFKFNSYLNSTGRKGGRLLKRGK